MINTPAHNPTGYSLSLNDWGKLISIVNDAPCKVALFLDIAYIDYAGEEDEVRAFLPMLAGLGDNVLPIFGCMPSAYSSSTTSFSLIGLRDQYLKHLVSFANSPNTTNKAKSLLSFVDS